MSGQNPENGRAVQEDHRHTLTAALEQMREHGADHTELISARAALDGLHEAGDTAGIAGVAGELDEHEQQLAAAPRSTRPRSATRQFYALVKTKLGRDDVVYVRADSEDTAIVTAAQEPHVSVVIDVFESEYLDEVEACSGAELDAAASVACAGAVAAARDGHDDPPAEPPDAAGAEDLRDDGAGR